LDDLTPNFPLNPEPDPVSPSEIDLNSEEYYEISSIIKAELNGFDY